MPPRKKPAATAPNTDREHLAAMTADQLATLADVLHIAPGADNNETIDRIVTYCGLEPASTDA
jgi:hypothetical protein